MEINVNPCLQAKNLPEPQTCFPHRVQSKFYLLSIYHVMMIFRSLSSAHSMFYNYFDLNLNYLLRGTVQEFFVIPQRMFFTCGRYCVLELHCKKRILNSNATKVESLI